MPRHIEDLPVIVIPKILWRDGKGQGPAGKTGELIPVRIKILVNIAGPRRAGRTYRTVETGRNAGLGESGASADRESSGRRLSQRSAGLRIRRCSLPQDKEKHR